VKLLVIDEASLVTDDLYKTVRPMMAVSKGKLMVLSTPHGKRGWFYESWSREPNWQKVNVKSSECPRIDAGWLAEERTAVGEFWSSQEYETAFVDTVAGLFAQRDIDACLAPDLPAFVFQTPADAAAPRKHADDFTSAAIDPNMKAFQF